MPDEWKSKREALDHYMRIRRGRGKDIIIGVLFVLLVFQMALQASGNTVVATIFNYYDDVVSLLFAYLIGKEVFVKKKILINNYKILFLTILLCGLGMAGTLLYGFQPVKVAILDAFVCMKFALVLTGTRIWYQKQKDFDSILNVITQYSKATIIILFLLTMHEIFLPKYFRIWEIRYGMEVITLFFPHPVYFSTAVIALMSIVMISVKKYRFSVVYLIMGSIMVLFTFRAKASAFVLIMWLLYFWVIRFKIRQKYLLFCLIGIGAVAVGFNQIETYYFSNLWTPRVALLQDGITLAQEYFPLGAGLATFGSSTSVAYYSSVYGQFDYQSIWGMSRHTAQFLNDNFWGLILGQFGFIGALTAAYIFWNLYKSCGKVRKDSCEYVVVLAIFFYLLMSSVSELSIFSPYAPLFCCIYEISYQRGKTG